MNTEPDMNNVLIEVLRDDDGVSRTDSNETMKYGRLIDARVDRYHITASAAIRFDDDYVQAKAQELADKVGKVVRWEEFAEGGQTFEEDGKTFALIPWWRLIGYEENNKEEEK